MMNNNGELITIKEAAELTGINTTTIYKKIKKGKLICTCRQVQGVEIKQVKKADIIRLYGVRQVPSSARQVPEDDNQVPAGASQMPSSAERKNEIREVIEDFFSAKQAELVKPMEQNALYRLGRVEQENQFLHTKVETLLHEIEQYKALPCQIQERDEEIKIIIARHEKEKEELKIMAEKEKTEALEALKIQLKVEAEETQNAISEAWKKELEQAKRPWYKFW